MPHKSLAHELISNALARQPATDLLFALVDLLEPKDVKSLLAQAEFFQTVGNHAPEGPAKDQCAARESIFKLAAVVANDRG